MKAVTPQLHKGMVPRLIALIGLTLLVLTLLTAAPAFGQEATVQGTVTDAQSGTPLPGASVVVKGTTTGATTDAEGLYSIRVPSVQEDSLVFSFIGYQEQTVPVAGRSMIDVALAPQAIEGEEVIVVGYTAQKSRSVTGAVSSVSAEDLAERKVGTLEEALQGRIPGVEISSTGEPGQPSQITVRGVSFVGGNNQPLYVVDGVYTDQNPNIDPDNIASIRVLKDASAAAQYGSQAANGVILIETKKGQPGETEISLSSYYGFQSVPTRIDLMEADEWAEINQMANENAGRSTPEELLNPTVNTDWQDALFKPGAIQNYNLSVSGGSENATYLLSGGYLDQEGAVVGTGFKRYSVRINSELQRGIFTFGESASLSRSVRENMVGFPLIDVLRMTPVVPVFDSTNASGFGYGTPANPTFGTNPVGQQRTENDTFNSNQILGSLYGEVQIFDNLNYRLNLGIQYEDFNRPVFEESAQLRFNSSPDPAQLMVAANGISNLQVENLLTFDDRFGDHGINAVVGYTEQREEGDLLTTTREGFSNEELRTINAGNGTTGGSGSRTVTTQHSLLVRANYDYAERYLFTGSARRDGVSSFGPGNRYGTFISGSGGWVLSEEPFYASIPLLGEHVDFFKLRASYGELGNRNIPDYQFQGSINPNVSYVLGNGQIVSGAIQLVLANPNIQWQENRQFNAGLNLRLFENALTVDADYYVSTSDEVLVRAPLPPSLGSAANPIVNAGSIRNRGFELGLGYDDSWGDFQLSASANLTTITNEVLSLGNDDQPLFSGPFGVARTAVGDPLGSFFVIETDGLFQSEEEVQNYTSTVDGEEVVIQPGAQPGDVRFVDFNGDGTITNEDRQIAGDPYPDIEGGLAVDAGYKNVDLTLALRGRYGNDIFNVGRYWTNRLDEPATFREGLDPWTPDNRDTDTPRAVYGPQGAENSRALSDRWIEDGSYLRIQNIELGYTLPTSLTQYVGAEDASFRIYANVQNLYTFTGYSNWDPEAPDNGVLSRGVDDGQIYPNVRSFTFGVDLSL